MKSTAFSLIVILSACGIEIETEHRVTPAPVKSITIMTQPVTCYSLAEEARNISAQLRRQNVPHRLDVQEKCINSESMSPEAILSAEVSVFGEEPAAGLSISYGSGNAEAIKLLEEHGISIEEVKYRGNDYISWSYQDHEKAEELLGFEPWQKELHEGFRDARSSTPNKSSKGTP